MIILNFDEYNVHKKTIISELKKSIFVVIDESSSFFLQLEANSGLGRCAWLT